MPLYGQTEALGRGLRQMDIMEDQGSYGDRNAGFGSTDGQWHHIAATWESSTGIATLYLDGRKVRLTFYNYNNNNNNNNNNSNNNYNNNNNALHLMMCWVCVG